MVVVVGRGCNGRYGWDGGKMEGMMECLIKLFKGFGNGLIDGWHGWTLKVVELLLWLNITRTFK